MGDEETADERRAALAPYRIDDALLDRAAPDAIALHCLPAHPGEEITAEVLYGDRQRIWEQAENRRHAQKALLELLIRTCTRGGAVGIASPQRPHVPQEAGEMPQPKSTRSAGTRKPAARQARSRSQEARLEGRRVQGRRQAGGKQVGGSEEAGGAQDDGAQDDGTQGDH